MTLDVQTTVEADNIDEAMEIAKERGLALGKLMKHHHNHEWIPVSGETELTITSYL